VYLKRLELHGFKSFAMRTELEFAPGITAIVGPNGSGKSNVADAVRWVLGEQSMRQLRGKKSEDIIFAGAQGKAAMGMAEVSLFLDNSAGWLPSEYTEVKITRRSYRSGENEYLINNTKVRLRDLLILLAQARVGHDSYTVVGQGLVDAALSLRAEERRTLFEDAAGIRHFQAQRDDAETKLLQTEQNLARLRDILAEIEPRLAPLAEQARRAREYATVQAEYQSKLLVWYAQQWKNAQAQRQRAEEAEAERSAEMARIQEELGKRDGTLRDVRVEQELLAAQISGLRKTRGELMNRTQTLEREVAVGEERLASLSRQSGELEVEQEQQRQQVAAAAQRITALQQQITELADQVAQGADTLQEMERDVASFRQRQESEEARLRAAQREVIQIQTRLGASQSELGRLQRQLGERNRTLATRREALAQSQERLNAAQSKLEAQQHLLAAAHSEEEQLATKRQQLSRTISDAQEEQERLRESLGEARRARQGVADRLALLREWRSSLSGYSDGVRALLQAPGGKIPPIIGTVAQLATVAEGLEPALEAALGPLLQAVVVSSADDALACLEYLRSIRGGRALLVWASPGGSDGAAFSSADGESQGAEKRSGDYFGQRASALVSSLPEYRALFQRLLDDAVVVNDLASAGSYLERATHGRPEAVKGEAKSGQAAGAAPALLPQRIVTATGEVLHVQGWLSGGQTADANQGLLARERELRELPALLAQHDLAIEQREKLLDQARQAQEVRKKELATLEREAQQVAARLTALNREVQSLRQTAERALSELQVGRSVEEQLAGEVAGLEQELAAAQARVAEQEAALRDANERAEEVQEEVEQQARQFRERQEELNRRRTVLAVQRQEEKTLGQNLEQQRTQARDLEAQIQRRAERLREMERQVADLAEQMARQKAALEELRMQAQENGARLHNAEEQAAIRNRQVLELERSQGELRQEQAKLEVEYRRCLLDAQRSRDALETLLQQVQEELGVSDPALLLEQDIGEDGAESGDAETGTTRRRIDELRTRLKELSNHDPNALQEYEDARERYEFMTSQVQDMEAATANLRQLIAELDATMKRQFEETFHAVNECFRRHFTTLFRGGAAHLELTAPKDEERNGPAGGVEVLVQPPGKKVQDLSLLSGGERALVSAALLFALLETNPPPFCLMDEVDAALDETNVSRFCDILTTLSERTQFIVVTHNRVTMTAAGAIYGVSMGADSVSRILSMRMATVGS
jgi:chromosome segregation protein